jgi:hypothetical protein
VGKGGNGYVVVGTGAGKGCSGNGFSGVSGGVKGCGGVDGGPHLLKQCAQEPLRLQRREELDCHARERRFDGDLPGREGVVKGRKSA